MRVWAYRDRVGSKRRRFEASTTNITITGARISVSVSPLRRRSGRISSGAVSRRTQYCYHCPNTLPSTTIRLMFRMQDKHTIHPVSDLDHAYSYSVGFCVITQCWHNTGTFRSLWRSCCTRL
ncbi:hypothetical protein Cob_v002682 [Colletotrichum orbiculare MAFF 240422]|uniref:Uncharacterized protein n=1 Tax=Colletotrichum orbiculare (strain 104-T / ATCC 96160 / CBS 514.97 / LARS 414 / MAFF 240422) TaxID=1213857 RepID=A0A484FYM0_COLOR|nr:hypothetical protein Cob_v002682 [Colletotrichum orbiculare MAFF 240422]